MSPKDHVAVRLDNATLARVDALKDVLSTDWHEATRSDILRALILTGLARLEQQHKDTLGKPKKVALLPEGAPASKRSAAKKRGRPAGG